jgi:cell wall assembly regulator SMI1
VLFKTIKPEKEIRLSNGVDIKNVGRYNARLGLTLPRDVKVLRNNHKKNAKNAG